MSAFSVRRVHLVLDEFEELKAKVAQWEYVPNTIYTQVVK